MTLLLHLQKRKTEKLLFLTTPHLIYEFFNVDDMNDYEFKNIFNDTISAT